MVEIKKTIILFFPLFLLIFLSFHPQEKVERVEILYFRNEKCPLIENTDEIIQSVIESFGDKVEVRTFNAKLYPWEKESEEVSKLREKYEIIGLPEIIIQGRKFKKEFTRENLFREVCNYLLEKPMVCE